MYEVGRCHNKFVERCKQGKVDRKQHRTGGNTFTNKDLFGQYFATEGLRRKYGTISHKSFEAIQVVYGIDPKQSSLLDSFTNTFLDVNSLKQLYARDVLNAKYVTSFPCKSLTILLDQTFSTYKLRSTHVYKWSPS